ncbi:MAG: transporter [Nannocystaceae bacterium]|nr:transporter [Nannocystaceae bacterium]
MIEWLADSPLLLLFAVAGLGYLAGKIEIRGFGLGVSAVLFVGLGLGALDPRLRLPEVVHLFGLSTFVYVVGLASAPGFFASMRRRGLQAAVLALGGVAVAAGMAAVLGTWLGLPSAVIGGLFAGATTNTPALAAVIDAVGETAGQAGPVLGYSLAYPFGVLGVLATIALVPRILGIDYATEPIAREDAPGVGVHIESVTVEITRALPDVPSRALREQLGLDVVFSRVRRGDAVAVVTDDFALRCGDVVGLVGEAAPLDAAVAALGHRVHERLELDRSVIDFRRIVVSNPALAERPLEDAKLARFGAVVTRVRRGDIDLVPGLHTVLALGDAVRVVAPRERLPEIAKFLGDSQRALAEIDLISFSLGIGLGLALGNVAVPLPGGGSFSLGFAGGPLLVGLALGRIGRAGPLVWTLPQTASLTLRQVGLVLFLAGVGTRSGWALAEAVRQGGVLGIALAGMAITLAITSFALLLARRWLRLPASIVVGMMAGIQTQPADLAFACERTKSEVPTTGYAAVYPVATIAKIVAAQLLLWL